MSGDAVLYARTQFGITAVAHWLFVALTLGLVTFVVICQIQWYRKKSPTYERMTRFWGQLYVVNYAVGIATGIVMEFQFGLNWSGLTHFAGNVIGSPLSIETLVAFFLESTFLGMWIFGWNVVSRKVHLALITATAVTAWASVILVVGTNAFLQHPEGYTIENGKAVLTSIGDLLSNPNMWRAVPHVTTAAMTTGLVFVLGVSAWHLLKKPADHPDREVYLKSFRISLYTSIPFIFLTALLGGLMIDLVNVEQPIKGAIFDGDFDLARQEAAEAEAQYGPGNYVPPLAFAFWAKFIMRNSAILMLAVVGVVALLTIKNYFWRRPKLQKTAFRIFVGLIPLPFLAGASGWIFREIGRQPWAIYHVLKTEDAVSPRGAGAMLTSLIVFATLVITLAVIDWVLLFRIARRGPDAAQLGRGAPPATDDEPLYGEPTRRDEPDATVLEGSSR
ncbi:cytochrome ubiquinol oxidase subunit I [Streptomyces sp. 2A115]|uniref:cytochrome ubiquinol oxidase subunit I n=1 Tax=Streptomyces sp. 2A115 TaxID=3457439 RepID=UPI003FD6687C